VTNPAAARDDHAVIRDNHAAARHNHPAARDDAAVSVGKQAFGIRTPLSRAEDGAYQFRTAPFRIRTPEVLRPLHSSRKSGRSLSNLTLTPVDDDSDVVEGGERRVIDDDARSHCDRAPIEAESTSR